MDGSTRRLLGGGAAASAAVALIALVVLGMRDHGFIPAIGIGLGVLGLVLGWFALAHDPLGGRARCPRCAYELGLATRNELPTCPECGFVPGSPDDLIRTRKRWGIAMIACIMLLGVPGGFLARSAVRAGFWQAWPDWALIGVLPVAPSEAWLELDHRLTTEQGNLSAWEHRLLASRCVATIERERNLEIRLAALDILLWLEPDSTSAVEAFRLAIHGEDAYMADWAIKNAKGPWLAREFAMLIADPTVIPERRADAIMTARFWKLRDRSLFEAILKAVDDPEPAVRDAASDTIEVLQQAMNNPDRGRNSRGGLPFGSSHTIFGVPPQDPE